MANKIVSLLLQVKNAISPGVNEAADDVNNLSARTRELEKELNKFDNAKNAIDALDDTREAAIKAEQVFEETQTEVVKLKTALKSEKTPEIAVALEKAKVAATDAKKEWQASTKAVKNLETQITNAGGDLDDLTGSQKNLTSQVARTNGALKANKQQLEKARKGLSETAAAAEKTGNSFGSFVGKAAALLGIVTVVDKVRNGLRALSTSVYDTGTQFELLGTRLSDDELGYITEFARNAPQQLSGVADAFIKLRTFGLDPTNGSLQELVDYNAKVGGSQEVLEGIITAVGQAWSKQKLQQEEALQLMERGVPVWDLLSEAMGKTVPELQKMSTAGALGRKEITLLINAMGATATGQAQKQMSTMAGLVSNLQDRFTQFYRLIVDAGVWEYLKTQIKDVSDWFDQMANSGQLQKLAKNISDAFISSAESLKSFVTGLYDIRGELGLLAKAWLALKISSWYGQIRTATTGFVGLKTAIAGVTSSAGLMATALRGAVGVFVVTQAYKLVTAYRDLKLAMAELDQTDRARKESAEALATGLKKISDETGVTVSNMKELQQQIESGNIVIDEQSGKYLSAAQATDLYAQRQQQAADASEQQKINLNLLSEAYQSANKELKIAVDNNSKLASVMSGQVLSALNGGVEGVSGFALALKKAEQQGDLTAEQIETKLTAALAKLSEPEQQRFGELLKSAMEQVGDGADKSGLKIEYLQTLIDGLDTAKAENALKRLGTSQEEIAGGITKAMQQSLDDLDVLSGSISGLGTVSKQVSDQVYQALSGALDNVKTKADQTEFSASLREFAEQGAITAAQYYELAESVSSVGKAADDAGYLGAAGMERLRQSVVAVGEATQNQARDVQGLASDLASWYQGVRSELASLSEAALVAFDQSRGFNTTGALTEIESLQAAIEGMHEQMQNLTEDNLRIFDPTGIKTWENSVVSARDQVVIAFNEQKIKALEFNEALESGEQVSQRFINSAESSLKNMSLLGDEDLSTLRSALASAQAQLDAMSDSAKDALQSLQDELDQLNDNQEAIDQRDYENKKEELNEALSEARAAQNKEAISYYTDALKVLDQVRAEEKKQNAADAAESTTGGTSSTASTASAGATTTINLSTTGGNTATVQVSGSGVADLLTVLEEAGLRSS